MRKRDFLAACAAFFSIPFAARSATQNPIGEFSEPRPEKRTVIQVTVNEGLPASFPLDGRSAGTLKILVNDQLMAEVPVNFTVQADASGVLIPMVYTLVLPGPRAGRDVRGILTGHMADHAVAEVEVTEFER